MRSNNSSYPTYSNGGSRQRERSNRGRRGSSQAYGHQTYGDASGQQDPYAGSYDSYQDQGYGERYAQPYGQAYQDQQYGYATGQEAGYRQGRAQVEPAHGRRQTAADLGQVDNSQVAGRVAYDQDGNLVVVKKEEKAPVQMAAIVGSALSAVTSALFSSHIGIGGSLLTVAIGAAVSAAGTQLYTHVIKKSTDKLKSVVDNGLPNGQQITGVMDSSQLDADGYGYETQAVYGYDSEEGTPTPDGGRVAPQSMIDAAEERHQKQVKRRGIIIVAIMALVAVIVAAGVVTWATKGNGIGTKTPSIVSSVTQTAPVNENQTEDAAAANATETAQAPAATTNTDAAQDATTQTATNANTTAGSAASTTANQGAGTANANTPSASAGSGSVTSGSSGTAASSGAGSPNAANTPVTSGSNGAGAANSSTTANTTAPSADSSAGTADAAANNAATSDSATAGTLSASADNSGTGNAAE